MFTTFTLTSGFLSPLDGPGEGKRKLPECGLLVGNDAERRTVLGSLDCGFISVAELPVDLTGDRVSGRFGKLAFDLGSDPKISS